MHHNPKNAIGRQYRRRCQKFLDNIANGGFVFYAVPHSGAQNLELYIKNCDNMLKRKRRQDTSLSLLSNIHVFSRSMEELSVKFEDFVRDTQNGRPDDVIIYAFTESLPMTREDLVSIYSSKTCSLTMFLSILHLDLSAILKLLSILKAFHKLSFWLFKSLEYLELVSMYSP